jgi:hypothetical protein
VNKTKRHSLSENIRISVEAKNTSNKHQEKSLTNDDNTMINSNSSTNRSNTDESNNNNNQNQDHKTHNTKLSTPSVKTSTPKKKVTFALHKNEEHGTQSKECVSDYMTSVIHNTSPKIF